MEIESGHVVDDCRYGNGHVTILRFGLLASLPAPQRSGAKIHDDHAQAKGLQPNFYTSSASAAADLDF